MNTKEILTKARALISKPENWTTGVMARDKNGEMTYARNPDAKCRCLMGAIRFCCYGWHDEETAYAAFCIEDLAKFNDSHAHAEVLELIDKTIASLP